MILFVCRFPSKSNCSSKQLHNSTWIIQHRKHRNNGLFCAQLYVLCNRAGSRIWKMKNILEINSRNSKECYAIICFVLKSWSNFFIFFKINNLNLEYRDEHTRVVSKVLFLDYSSPRSAQTYRNAIFAQWNWNIFRLYDLIMRST